MIRQIIVPTSNIYTLQLQIPDNMIGKKITVIYDEEKPSVLQERYFTNLTKPSDIFKDCRVDLSNFKFNRDEANDYDDFFKKNNIDFKKDIDAFYDNIHLDISKNKFNRDEANER